MASKDRPDPAHAVLKVLRDGEPDDFRTEDRDQTYSELGISRAGEILATDLRTLSPKERNELVRLVLEFGQSKLPAVYPADEKYAESFERMGLRTSVTDLRARLGYPHFHTRDSILAKLRGFMFHSLLEHFDSYQEAHPDGEGFAESFLTQVAAKRLGEWREQIKDVILFSRHEDWEDARATRFADKVLEQMIGWFLANPQAFLDASDDADLWRGSLWSGYRDSFATRFFAAVFHHLRILKASEGAKKPRNPPSASPTIERVDGGAGVVESSRAFLVESSWYRHFFFDERGISRWTKYGTSGLENEETLDDFTSKLEARATWRKVFAPSGATVNGAEEIRQRRLLGAYRVEWQSGETQVVYVKPIPTLEYHELLEFVEAPPSVGKTLDLQHGLWMIRLPAISEGQIVDLVVRSTGREWSKVVRTFRMASVLVAVVKVPGPGRYLVSIPGTVDSVTEIAEGRESEPVVDVLYDIERSVVRLKMLAELVLESPPTEASKDVSFKHDSGDSTSEWTVHLIEPSVGLYRLEATVEIPAESAGTQVSVSSPVLKRSLSVILPDLAVLQGPTGGARVLPGATSVATIGMAQIFVLANTPFEILLPGGHKVATVRDGNQALVEAENAKLRISNRGIFTKMEVIEDGGTFLRELVLQSGTRLMRLVRRREIRIDVRPVLGKGETRWIVEAGSPTMMKVEVLPATTEPVTIRMEGAGGARESRLVTGPTEFRIPENLLVGDTILLSARAKDCAPIEAEIISVAKPAIDGPRFLEVGAMDEGVRVSCRSSFSLRGVRGDFFQWTSQPRPWRPTKESLVMVRPHRTSDALCRIYAECVYEGIASIAGHVTVETEVPLVWIEVRHRGERVQGWEIQGFRGETVSAILRSPMDSLRAFAVCRSRRVELSRSPTTSPDLTATLDLRGLRDPVELSFVVLENGHAEKKLAKSMRISPRFVPHVYVPDGLAWHTELGYAVLIPDTKPGLKVSVTEATTSHAKLFDCPDGVAKVTCPSLPVSLELQDDKGNHLAMQSGEERQSLSIRKSESSRATVFLVPDTVGGYSQLAGPASDFPATQVIEALARTSKVICVEVPSLLVAVPFVREVSRLGWTLVASEGLQLLVGPVGTPLAEGAPPATFAASDTSRNDSVAFLDSYDGPSWESFIPIRGEGVVVVLVPSGTLSVRADKSIAVRRLGEAIQGGKLLNPHASPMWRSAIGERESKHLGRAVAEDGLEDVLVQGIVAVLRGDAEALLRDKAGCENLGRLIAFPRMLSRISPVRLADLRAALVEVGRFVLSGKSSTNFEADAASFHSLVAGWDGNASADPRDELLSEEYDSIWNLMRLARWEDALALMRKIVPVFKERPWIRWDYPGLVLEARVAGYGSYEEFRDAVMQLERLRREGLLGLARSPFRGRIESILRQRHCPECGGIILTSGKCYNCKATYLTSAPGGEP